MKDQPKSSSAKPAGHGGARKGAGRKPKALRYAAELAAAEAKIVAASPRIIDALLTAAEGGDSGAARYLLDRIFGRVREQTSVLCEDQGAPLDHPRSQRSWAREDEEADAEEFIAEARRLTPAADATRQLVSQIAASLDFELSKVSPGDAAAFQAWQKQRLDRVYEIISTNPPDEWPRQLAGYDAQNPKPSRLSALTETTPISPRIATESSR